MISFSSKDLPFFFNEQLQNFYYYPYVWDSTRGNGFGEDISGVLWLRTFIYSTAGFLHNSLGLDWFWITIVYYSLFVLFSGISIYFFVRTLFGKNWYTFFISLLIYISNTYILMIIHGGQVGVMLAYSLTPLVLGLSIKLLQNNRFNIKLSLITGFFLALQAFLDVRLAYMSFVFVCFLFLVFSYIHVSRKSFLQFFSSRVLHLVICAVTVFLLHSFWILPSVFSLQDTFESGKGDVSVDFLSFAELENSISLLHPNWPENIFGKVYFMRPEFLILPLLAFSSLLFNKNPKSEYRNPKQIQNSNTKIKNNLTMEQFNNRTIIFFAFLGLFGAFLAKGTNEPFGSFYLWLYNFIPGFSLFRDPTKWYVLVAIAYAYLIPFTIQKRGVLLSGLFVLFWGYLLFPIFQHAQTGVFPRVVPDEYIELKDELIQDAQFSRVLWIPTVSRYSYSSATHPAVSFEEFFKASSASAVIKSLKRDSLTDILETNSIGYIVIPVDEQHEIPLKEKGYTQKKSKELKSILSSKKTLKEMYKYQGLSVFKVAEQKDLFWCIGKCRIQLYRRINPTQYEITLENVHIGDKLVFSQANNKHWILEADKQSEPDAYNSLMTFQLSKSGTYSVRLVYQKQQLADMGLVVSGVTLVSLPFLFFFNPPSRKSPIVRSWDAEPISASADFSSDKAHEENPRPLGRGSFKKK